MDFLEKKRLQWKNNNDLFSNKINDLSSIDETKNESLLESARNGSSMYAKGKN
jgi:hypothetical protein